MTNKIINYNELTVRQKNQRKKIFAMIDDSCKLAAQKGYHPLGKGCSCISCVNKRKRLIVPFVKNWKYKL